jgi:transcriptional regulator with XRE-family HTH domain
MSVINWLNDSLLFDLETQPVNQWINANELILQNRGNEIFLSDGKVNLYPIMVRKNDFVRTKTSDRIMARFPFLIIDEKVQKQIKDKILLISEVTRNYFYKSTNKSITEWKMDIQKYLARGTLPFPIVRCCFELLPNLHALTNKTSLCFTSARGEAFKMPTNLTKELAYLAGMVNGDGNLQKYTLRIVDYSIKNIKQLQTMFKEYFHQTGNILYKTPNSPEVVITNLWVVRLFSFLTGQPIGIKKYKSLREPLVLKDNPVFRSYYWSGVMDADGSYKNRNVRFASASKDFTEDLQSYLLEHDIVTKLDPREDGTFFIFIPNKYHCKLRNLLVCMHPEKQKEFQQLSVSYLNQPKSFVKIKEENLFNGYFNFKLLKGLYVLGLAKQFLLLRNGKSLSYLAKELGTNHQTLSNIEKEIRGISISLLEKLLSLKNIKLMPFLSQHNDIVSYYKANSKTLKLPVKPDTRFINTASNLSYYKNKIVLKNDIEHTRNNLQEIFDLKVYDNYITDKVIMNFYKTFCVFD